MESFSGLLICIFIVSTFITFVISKRKKIDKRDNPILETVRSNFSRLNEKFANIPLFDGKSAYTENKEEITLCLVDPDSKRNYDINTIMYVALHELAHVITPEGKEEHGPEFRQNFANLLVEGTRAGIYDPNKKIPDRYCNVETH